MTLLAYEISNISRKIWENFKFLSTEYTNLLKIKKDIIFLFMYETLNSK